MPNTAHNYRYSPLSIRSVFRFAFLSEASGFLGVVTKGVRETGGKQTPGGPFSCRAFVGLMVRAQTVVNVPEGFTGAAGHTALEIPLVGGSIHLKLSQCGWTF
jgi:hypothetical protein